MFAATKWCMFDLFSGMFQKTSAKALAFSGVSGTSVWEDFPKAYGISGVTCKLESPCCSSERSCRVLVLVLVHHVQVLTVVMNQCSYISLAPGLLTMDPTLHYKKMGHLSNRADVGGAEQKTETDKCHNWLRTSRRLQS